MRGEGKTYSLNIVDRKGSIESVANTIYFRIRICMEQIDMRIYTLYLVQYNQGQAN